MNNYVISVPHADCDPKGVDWPHPCDPVAEPTAFYLAEHLKRRGRHGCVLVGNICRAQLDLNRPESVNSDFHKSLERLVAPGCVYVDMHSFPGDDEYWGKKWGDSDLVLCAYPNVNDQASIDVCRKLRSHGVRCKVQMPDTLPLIKDYYLIQKFGPLARIPLMIELNESTSPQRRNSVMQALSTII